MPSRRCAFRVCEVATEFLRAGYDEVFFLPFFQTVCFSKKEEKRKFWPLKTAYKTFLGYRQALEDLDDEGIENNGGRQNENEYLFHVKEVTGEMTEHLDAIMEKYNAKKEEEEEDDNDEEKAAYREAFSGLLTGLANRFVGGIESDEAFNNCELAFGDVNYVVVNLLEEMKEKEKERWAPMLNVACDLALDSKTSVEIGRECYRLLNKLVERCKFNVKKFGDEVLLDPSSNNRDDELAGGSQRNASRLKKLARAAISNARRKLH